MRELRVQHCAELQQQQHAAVLALAARRKCSHEIVGVDASYKIDLGICSMWALRVQLVH